MFICEDCLNDKEIAKRYADCGKSILPVSRGNCEECGKVKDCHEVYIHDD